jgi:hypothetical protein
LFSSRHKKKDRARGSFFEHNTASGRGEPTKEGQIGYGTVRGGMRAAGMSIDRQRIQTAATNKNSGQGMRELSHVICFL